MKCIQEPPEKHSMFQLALMILYDQCPPDNRMYLCGMGEDDSCDCTMCWDKYLWWAAQGYKGDPYKWDKICEVT